MGVQVGAFTVSGQGSSFQLLGIANELRAPPVAVQPGQTYCVSAQALADSPASATRVRVVFRWLDAEGRAIKWNATSWQEARQWQGPQDRGGWSVVSGAFAAPPGAEQLAVVFQPSSDDRVYLDQILVRTGGTPGMRDEGQGMRDELPLSFAVGAGEVKVLPWPEGRAAALSFSFDWETAMGGLIHSRSVTDPNFDQNPILRGMRMREGVTTTLAIFRPYNIRATYYATGYNFLLGNPERRSFMGNPTFRWATSANRWTTDAWATTAWFSADPYGTVQTDPAWYFGDLIALLRAEGQDVQSHTFSHLYGGLASNAEWRADLAAWNAVAAERGVAPARSLAFPWSGSAGMSDANWQLLAESGITSVTRTSVQAQYRLVGPDEPRCRAVPGHATILACPDFYLTERSAAEAPQVIERAINTGGMIDLWAHTEEVVTERQIAAWGEVVRYAAQRRDEGALWIAPLAEIAERQRDVARLSVRPPTWDGGEGKLVFAVTNGSGWDLEAVAFELPFAAGRVEAGGRSVTVAGNVIHFDLAAGETVAVSVYAFMR